MEENIIKNKIQKAIICTLFGLAIGIGILFGLIKGTGSQTGNDKGIEEDKVLGKYNQTEKIKQEYKLEKTALVKSEKIKDGVRAEIGDKNAADFTPQVQLQRWEGEAGFKVKYTPEQGRGSQDVRFEDNQIVFEDGDVTIKYYDLGETGENLEGAYEMEMILGKEPKTNIMSFDIEIQNLDFFFQPALNLEQHGPEVVSCTATDCYDESGRVIVHRPENVVGSYAVYYQGNKSGDYSLRGGKNYKAGKAFHIYRPKIFDATGKWVWGELNIDTRLGKMTVTIPQDFLDTAEYPIRHATGATFGYTSIGVSTDSQYANRQVAAGPFSPDSDGTTDSISWYINTDLAATFGLFSQVSSKPKAILVDTAGASYSAGASWKTQNTDSAYSITSGTNYWIGLNDNGDIDAFYYDSGSGGGYWEGFTYSAGTLSTFTDWPNAFGTSRSYSAYVTYTSVPNLTQIHYRWRNDDGSETAATWGAAEDTATSSISIGEVKRLRIEVSNEGTASSSQMYILQYGTASTTGFAIKNDWYSVPDSTNCGYSAFCMNASGLTEGSATTDVASGLTNENTTFVAGLQKEDNATTTHISLDTTNFTEIEYAFAPTSYAMEGMTYFFRLATTTGTAIAYPLDTHTIMPQLTMSNPKPIYRSVGKASADVQKGSATTTLSIWDSIATFSSAMPNIVGVGDAIQYDSDNNASIDSIAFIDYRFSSTQYRVKTNLGAMATSTFATTTVIADEDWAAYRAYISLANAETGTENTGIASAVRNFDTWSGGKTLVPTSSNEIWNIAAYADGADTTAVTISGWVMSTSTYLRVYTPTSTSEVGTSQRHNGTWGTGYRRDTGTGASTNLVISNNFVRIDGIAGKASGVSYTRVIYLTSIEEAGEIHLSNNFGWISSVTPIVSVFYVWGVASTYFYAWNNIGINDSTERTGDAFNLEDADVIAYFYNNTGITSAGRVFRRTTGTGRLVNNIGYVATGTAAFSGTWIDVHNNASNDATADDWGGLNNQINQTFSFNDAENENYHLSSADVGAKDLGLNISASSTLALSFTTDIDWDTRPENSIWDIGADEATTTSALSVSASTTVTFSNVNYSFWAQTSTATNVGAVYVTGGGGTWTLNASCQDNSADCEWYGQTEMDRFQMNVGATSTNASSSGIMCFDWSDFSCAASPCTGVTLSSGIKCYPSTKADVTMATGSSATGNYWLKESDWYQSVPGLATASLYTTTLTFDLQ